MTIKIKLGDAETGAIKPTQAQVPLHIKKTLEGNLLIDDHPYIDIVIVPAKNKIVTLPKPDAEKESYDYQREFMHALFKGGIIEADAPQGGIVFGMIEAHYAAESDVNSLQALLFQVGQFIQKAHTEDLVALEYDHNIEDNFVNPPEDKTTRYGEVPPYQDTPAGQQSSPLYSYAGYGYLY